MRKLVGLGIAALLLGLSGSVQANEAALWGKVGDWDIRVDDLVANGCFMSAEYATGLYIRVGIDNSDHSDYIWVSHPDWSRALTVGRRYTMEFQFDDNEPHVVNGIARSMGADDVVLEFDFYPSDGNKPLQSFAASQHLTLTYQGKEAASVTLRDADDAAKAVVQCSSGPDTPTSPFNARS